MLYSDAQFYLFVRPCIELDFTHVGYAAKCVILEDNPFVADSKAKLPNCNKH